MFRAELGGVSTYQTKRSPATRLWTANRPASSDAANGAGTDLMEVGDVKRKVVAVTGIAAAAVLGLTGCYGDGVHRDTARGVYRPLTPVGPNCTFSVADMTDIYVHSYRPVEGTIPRMTVDYGSYFTSEGCGTWILESPYVGGP